MLGPISSSSQPCVKNNSVCVEAQKKNHFGEVKPPVKILQHPVTTRKKMTNSNETSSSSFLENRVGNQTKSEKSEEKPDEKSTEEILEEKTSNEPLSETNPRQLSEDKLEKVKS